MRLGRVGREREDSVAGEALSGKLVEAVYGTVEWRKSQFEYGPSEDGTVQHLGVGEKREGVTMS